jgi:hypothetical protein
MDCDAAEDQRCASMVMWAGGRGWQRRTAAPNEVNDAVPLDDANATPQATPPSWVRRASMCVRAGGETLERLRVRGRKGGAGDRHSAAAGGGGAHPVVDGAMSGRAVTRVGEDAAVAPHAAPALARTLRDSPTDEKGKCASWGEQIGDRGLDSLVRARPTDGWFDRTERASGLACSPFQIASIDPLLPLSLLFPTCDR